MKIRILDEKGDTTLEVESKEDLLKEVGERNLSNKWFFIDDKFTPDIKQVEIPDTSEVTISEPLVGG